MKRYILCGDNAITDEDLLKELNTLIEDAQPYRSIRGDDLSSSEYERCYAYLFFQVMYNGELVEIIDVGIINESGTVDGFDLVTGQYVEIPKELL